MTALHGSRTSVRFKDLEREGTPHVRHASAGIEVENGSLNLPGDGEEPLQSLADAFPGPEGVGSREGQHALFMVQFGQFVQTVTGPRRSPGREEFREALSDLAVVLREVLPGGRGPATGNSRERLGADGHGPTQPRQADDQSHEGPSSDPAGTGLAGQKRASFRESRIQFEHIRR